MRIYAGWSSDINGAEKLKENHSLCCQPLLLYPAEAASARSDVLVVFFLLSPFSFSFLILPFLPFPLLPVGLDEIMLSHFLSCLEIFTSLLAVRVGAKSGQ